MSERKVINKYYPPDFDASLIPRGPSAIINRNLPRTRQITIRLMAPMSMRCNSCGEYIYKGKKFNARQETVRNEDYLGLRIYRFYIKCPCCVSEITFKTDPANTDYSMEHGATRSFQAARIAEKAEEDRRAIEEEEEKTNPMQALENRTKESRREMEKLEHLEELRDLNKRQISIDHDILIASHVTKITVSDLNDTEDDNTLINEIFYKKNDIHLNSDEESSKEIKKASYKFQIGKVSAPPPKLGKSLVKLKKNKDAKNDANYCVKLVNAYSSSDSDAT